MGDFLAAVAKRRHVNADDAQAVIQILAELSLGDALLEVRVGGGQHPYVHGLWPRLADRHDLALFQKPQQLWLDIERQVADLVEEQACRPSAERISPCWSVIAPVKLPRR